MARLKQATASWHDGLEALPRMRRLVDPALTRGEYLEILWRFYRSHRIVEGHLRARAGVWEVRGLDWSSRLGKTRWLEEDLRRLDPDAWELFHDGPDSALAIPADRDGGGNLVPYQGDGLAHAAGCLYVLEGATLGSRVILGLLGRARERPAEGATRFFQGYGPRTGERWAALGRDLQTHLGQDEEALTQALTTARETYALLGVILGGR